MADAGSAGLNLPLAAWFKEDLSSFARSRLLRLGAIMPHVVARERIERLLAQHDRLEKDWSGALWTMLIFEIWCARRGLGPDTLAVTLSREPASAGTMALAQ